MPSITNSQGLTIPYHQYTEIPDNLRHETFIIPSTSAPVWGGFFVFDFKEKGCVLHDLYIQFNTSAVTGLTGTVTNYPNYNPATFFFTRLEIYMNGVAIDTRYPVEQFLHNQFFYTDEDRYKCNTGAGLYASAAARNALTTTASTMYVDLTTVFQLAHVPILFQTSEIQLRIYMDTLANQVNTSTLTGTPTATIPSANLITKITRLSSDENNKLVSQHMRAPQHYLFNEIRYGSYTIQSGTSSTNIVLSSITGPVAYLFFVVRPTASMTGSNQYSFTQIASFSILDSTSTNIVGGQDLPSSLVLNMLCGDWTLSSYVTESGNNAYAYLYSFSSDPVATANTGARYGNHYFQGNEQQKITFTSSLSAAVQVDVYASVEAVLEISSSYCRKVTV